ncbi:MAG: hypothetical protein ACI4GY_09995 [Acutalibacteraceae bacterium]
MDTEIIVAIIGASGAVLAAVITGIFKVLKKDKARQIKINQKQSGKNNTQIGIQNNYGGESNE